MENKIEYYENWGFKFREVTEAGVVLLEDINALPTKCPNCENVNFTKYATTRLRLYKDIYLNKPTVIGIKRKNYQCTNCKKTMTVENPYLYNKNMTISLRDFLLHLITNYNRLSNCEIGRFTGFNEKSIRRFKIDTSLLNKGQMAEGC